MCAIFGVFNVPKAAELTVIGLHANQHRAIDYAGITTSDGEHLYQEHGVGLARQVFKAETLKRLHGHSALGHIRYPTVKDNSIQGNIQPISGIYNGLPIAIAHNGNITNLEELWELFPDLSLSTSMDTEYIVRLLERNCSGDIVADIAKVCELLKGSFSLGILFPDRLIAVRDSNGNRPLSLGRLNGGYCISSETCAFSNVNAEPLFDVEAGAIVTINLEGICKRRFLRAVDYKQCRFESIYFSHPASAVFGEEVSDFRVSLGKALEEHCPALGADIVTPIPDSSNFIAMGFGQTGRSGTFLPVIMRSHYAGRSFIAADQARRDSLVAQKFSFAAGKIKGKNIVVVDDSIVRGTTLPKIVKVLRQLSAKSIHVRIGSPPIKHSCIYGINTPTTLELISASASPKEICDQVGADSLEFLPLEVLKSLSSKSDQFCYSCMTGEYW